MLIREVFAFSLAALFAAVVMTAVPSGDDNTNFFIALIGSLAIWEGARYVLKARSAGK